MADFTILACLILFVALCEGDREGGGSFFLKYKSDGIDVTSRDVPHISSEFFRCGHSSDCVYVGRKGRDFSSVPEQPNDFMRDFDEVWKKTEIQTANNLEETTSNSLSGSYFNECMHVK